MAQENENGQPELIRAFTGADVFVTTRIGDPIRLLPFGELYRDGKVIEITPDIARQFKIPHFKPPAKLGGHADETRAGGHLVGLEVVEDNRYGKGPGLYGVPEWNEAGREAVERGDYRYLSPEILWKGWIEDATTGERTEGPAITGLALLHNPALGEAAAFYTADKGNDEDETSGGAVMSEQQMTVPREMGEGMIARFNAWLEDRLSGDEPAQRPEPAQPDPAPQNGDGPDSDELAALQAKANEADELRAQLEERQSEIEQYRAEQERMEAEQKRAERVAHFAAAFEDTVLADDDELHATLADIEDEERAEALVTKYKALAAQAAESNLEDELGASDDTVEGADGVDAAVRAKMKADGVTYVKAFEAIQREQPELFE